MNISPALWLFLLHLLYLLPFGLISLLLWWLFSRRLFNELQGDIALQHDQLRESEAKNLNLRKQMDELRRKIGIESTASDAEKRDINTEAFEKISSLESQLANSLDTINEQEKIIAELEENAQKHQAQDPLTAMPATAFEYNPDDDEETAALRNQVKTLIAQRNQIYRQLHQQKSPETPGGKSSFSSALNNNSDLQESKIAELEELLQKKHSQITRFVEENKNLRQELANIKINYQNDPSNLHNSDSLLNSGGEGSNFSSNPTNSTGNLHYYLLLKNLKTALSHRLAGALPDEFTNINGVSPETRAKLRTFGVRTFRQIATWDDDELDLYAQLIGVPKAKIIDKNWQQQARDLHLQSHGEPLG